VSVSTQVRPQQVSPEPSTHGVPEQQASPRWPHGGRVVQYPPAQTLFDSQALVAGGTAQQGSFRPPQLSAVSQVPALQ
jgi:hypothetical protein